MGRPYTILSCAMSLDGHIDDTAPERLVLSGEADLDEVDELRAWCDAILVGAGTVRRDDPRLLIRSAERRHRRVEAGGTASPVRVVLSDSGVIEPSARLLTAGDSGALVYTGRGRAEAERRLAGLDGVTVVDAGEPMDLAGVLGDLAWRGIGRLLVEGGERVHTLFLTQGLADELRLAVAPFLVGDDAAPRFVGAGAFPHTPEAPMTLVETRAVGSTAVLRYRTGIQR